MRAGHCNAYEAKFKECGFGRTKSRPVFARLCLDVEQKQKSACVVAAKVVKGLLFCVFTSW